MNDTRREVIDEALERAMGNTPIAAKYVVRLVKTFESLVAKFDTQHTRVEKSLADVEVTVSTFQGLLKEARGIFAGYEKRMEDIESFEHKPGKDGTSVDEEAVVGRILKSIPKPKDGKDGKDGKAPKIDEVVNKVMERITMPKDGEDADVDSIVSMVVEKILSEKLLKKEHIDGLDSEIASYRNQLAGRSYGKDTWARGGGDTVSAGSNITITSLSNGTKRISSTGGSGGNYVYSEVVAGSGTTWTLAQTPINGSLMLYANGQRLTPVVDYTIAGAAITTVSSWATGTLLADYQY